MKMRWGAATRPAALGAAVAAVVSLGPVLLETPEAPPLPPGVGLDPPGTHEPAVVPVGPDPTVERAALAGAGETLAPRRSGRSASAGKRKSDDLANRRGGPGWSKRPPRSRGKAEQSVQSSPEPPVAAYAPTAAQSAVHPPPPPPPAPPAHPPVHQEFGL